MTAIPVIVVDELDAAPGRAAEVLAAYETEYAEGARARGMRLLHRWVSPPTMAAATANRLLFVWEVDGVEGWWAQRAGGREPAVADFWRRLTPLLESRTRRHYADPAQTALLEDVLEDEP